MANFRFPRLTDFKDPKKRLQLILIGGAFFLAFLFFLAILLPATSSPKSCMLFCHSMNREYYTWQQSSHSNITCTACHAKPGLVAFLEEKAIALPIVIAEINGAYEKPIDKKSKIGFEEIPSKTCERCHNLATRNVTPSLIFKDKMLGKGFKSYHAKHLKKGMTCTLCHNRVTHKDVNEPVIMRKSGFSPSSEEAKHRYKNGMNMTEGCFRCHSPFKKERDKELIEKYKADDAPTGCTTCHDKKILPMGHGKNWVSIHTQAAKKSGFDYCWKCHDKGKRFQSADGKRSRCRDCHHRIMAKTVLTLKNCVICHKEMGIDTTTLVTRGQNAIRLEKNHNKAQYLRRMVYHKVHFPKNFKCTKCHLADLETTKKATLELCKNNGCHPPGQKSPASGAKLCMQCHKQPHQFLGK